jgi:hypothetical protein
MHDLLQAVRDMHFAGTGKSIVENHIEHSQDDICPNLECQVPIVVLVGHQGLGYGVVNENQSTKNDGVGASRHAVVLGQLAVATDISG